MLEINWLVIRRDCSAVGPSAMLSTFVRIPVADRPGKVPGPFHKSRVQTRDTLPPFVTMNSTE